MSILPTPEEELEGRIREECFQEQFKTIHEISKDVRNRFKAFLYSLIQEGVSVRILYKVISNVDLISWDGNLLKLLDDLTDDFLKVNKKEEDK